MKKVILLASLFPTSIPWSASAQVIDSTLNFGSTNQIANYYSATENFGASLFSNNTIDGVKEFFEENPTSAEQTGLMTNAYRYVVADVKPSVAGDYVFWMKAARLDTLMYVFEDNFDPNNFTNNFFGGNDDHSSGFGANSELGAEDFLECVTKELCPATKLKFEANKNYKFVLTHYSSRDFDKFQFSDTDPFTVNVRGPASVTITDDTPPSVTDITGDGNLDTNLGVSLNYAFNGGTLIITSSGQTISESFSFSEAGGTINTESYNVTFSGSFTSETTTTFSKTGNGTLILTGESGFAGTTFVTEGTLGLQGSLASDVNIAAGAALWGSGTIAGNVMSKGKISAGNGIGTLQIGANTTLSSASTTRIEIDGNEYKSTGGSGSYDRIAVTGANATFKADGTLQPVLRGIPGDATNSFVASYGDEFTIVTTAKADGVTGQFSQVQQPTAGLANNARFEVAYGGNKIDLLVTPANYEDFALGLANTNVQNAARALDDIRPAAGRSGDDEASKLFAELYPLKGGDLSKALVPLASEIHVLTLDDIRSGTRSLYQNDRLHSLFAVSDGKQFWGDVSGAAFQHNDDHDATAHQSKGGNLWLGLDLKNTPEDRYGFALGYRKATLDANLAGEARHDQVLFMGYAAKKYGPLQLSTKFGIGKAKFETERDVALSTTNATARADASADIAFFSVRGGYVHKLSEQWIGEIYGDVNIDLMRARAYKETGNELINTRTKEETYRSGNFNFGYQVTYLPENKDHNYYIGVGFTRDFGDARVLSREIEMHSTSWNVTGHHTPNLSGYLSLGAGFKTGKDARVAMSITARGNQKYNGIEGGISITKRW